MIKQASIFSLLLAAVVGLQPLVNLTGCYPHDYDPTTPAIDAPSQAQVDTAAAAAGSTAAAGATAAGQPLLAPFLDLGARLAVLIAAWFISKKYPKKEQVTPAKG